MADTFVTEWAKSTGVLGWLVDHWADFSFGETKVLWLMMHSNAPVSLPLFAKLTGLSKASVRTALIDLGRRGLIHRRVQEIPSYHKGLVMQGLCECCANECPYPKEHHLDPDGPDEMANVTYLCPNCHDAFHPENRLSYRLDPSVPTQEWNPNE